ncbi:MAG: nucleoside hydrolase [Sedimentisphaerales bacterium]|nr:nucleoside hydrolase [Sedimentisphaerales bacterium]
MRFDTLKKWLLLLILGLLIPQLFAAKIPVIYDSDIGDDIDDTWALGLLLKSPEYDVKLVVGDQGKSEYRAKLFAKFLTRAGRTDIPIGMALDVNATGGGRQSEWVKDFDLASYPGKIHKDGVQAIIDTIMRSEQKITLICVGPVPNIAEALRRQPRIAEKARFVGMHGSVRKGYGGKSTIDAEYNVRADAKACQKVLSADWPITITPLDTCGLVHLTGDKYQKVRNSDDPIAKAIIENYRLWSENKETAENRSSTLFDPVAVYLGLETELCKMETLSIRVDDEGYTRIDPQGKRMEVATAWKDMGAFEDLLVARLTRKAAPAAQANRFRRLAVDEYVDKMKGGWIGQMAGVGWGGPTEFRWQGQIIPEDQMPVWKPEMINQFGQDDIYVEMTFLRTLEVHGMDVSIRQAGIDFANSGYALWHANRAGRDNLRSGIAPPDSGHPQFNAHADDIDYQIEADYSGLIAPGLPNVAIELGEIFGRLMNYGDGLYGGQFVGGMYAEAFFEDNPLKIVLAGLKCIPAQSQYAECIRDVLTWYKKYPDDWQKTWQLIEAKYQDNPDYRRASCDKGDFNIDAKINGAYIVMGLLYGESDMDKTIIISTRCGQDSDCNPANSGGILGTVIGFKNLPDKFKSALNQEGKFSHTPYNFPTLIKVNEKLVRESVLRRGGKSVKDDQGKEVFLIPIEEPKPSPFEQCWEPGPVANSRFTEKEMKQITAVAGMDLSSALVQCAPGWKASRCGADMNPGLYETLHGKKNVLMTHPLDQQTCCILQRKVKLPAGKKSILQLTVGHDPRGDWDLIVKAENQERLKKVIGPQTAKNGWLDIQVDLSDLAGKEVNLQLINQANGWAYEAGLWANIEIKSN